MAVLSICNFFSQVLGSGGSECSVTDETTTREDGQYNFRGLLVRALSSAQWLSVLKYHLLCTGQSWALQIDWFIRTAYMCIWAALHCTHLHVCC